MLSIPRILVLQSKAANHAKCNSSQQFCLCQSKTQVKKDKFKSARQMIQSYKFFSSKSTFIVDSKVVLHGIDFCNIFQLGFNLI